MIRLIGAASFATVLLCALASCGGGSKSGSGGGGGSGPTTTETSAHPPLRARFLRTDVNQPERSPVLPPTSPCMTASAPAFHQQPTLNRIEVFDGGGKRSQLGTDDGAAAVGHGHYATRSKLSSQRARRR